VNLGDPRAPCPNVEPSLFVVLCQMNGVNGEDILFSFDVCVCAQRTGQSHQFKTVKATDFKFDVHVSRDSPDTTP